MSKGKTIVMLTQAVDPHVEPVAEVLRQRCARIFRFDLQDFPTNIQLKAEISPENSWQGSLAYDGQTVDLENIQSVWCRRARQYQAPAEVYTPPERAFLNLEN